MSLFAMKKPFSENVHYFLKWMVLGCIIGGIGGLAGGFFARCIVWVTEFRQENDWTLFLLPAAGVLIVLLYRITGEEKNRGTNMVIEAISSNEEVSGATGPLIFISTVLTHLAGGSAGREGAALQLGGSIGNVIGHRIDLDEKDKKIAVMCGMSAVFGALFGTPVAAAIFSMEVISIGVMYYAALVPCLLSSFLGASMAEFLGVEKESYSILQMPELGLSSGAYVIVLGMMCAVVSIGFCMLLHGSEHFWKKRLANPYLRILAASALLMIMTFLAGTRDYNGGSMGLIESAMEGHARYWDFRLKALFTAVTLGGGFKGGEIVPTLCVGSTFGCVVGQLTGISPSFSAACGMAALFVGVTNCPVSSLLIALELFGGEGLPFFAIVVAVSFTLSGYYGLYSSQKFVYSKTKTEFINRKTNE